MDTCFIEHTETAEIVTQLDDDNFLVNIKMQLISVKKAASCLLIPDAQDKVLIINTKDKEYYIICVLEKKSRQNNIKLGDSSISLSPDSIDINANNFIVNTTNTISFRCKIYKVTANVLNYRFDVMNFMGKKIAMYMESMQVVCKSWQEKVSRYTSDYKELFKNVHKVEQSKIASSRTIVKGKYRIDSDQIDLNSKEDTTINAKQLNVN